MAAEREHTLQNVLHFIAEQEQYCTKCDDSTADEPSLERDESLEANTETRKLAVICNSEDSNRYVFLLDVAS